ncbi:MAG: UDP-N-acetylglucosamine--N-acetylmuramyl-(pentapeptide) pyrophosphoryl-undecaprenol N-acetylglucosamine transferase, partial [Gemmatimonadales bacterium]
MTTILLAGGGTGGHLMPALAIAEATGRLHPDWRFVFAGAERGIEASVLPGRRVPYHLLPFQPLYRRQWWKNIRWPALLPSLLRRIDIVLDQEQPAAVIGTGGYVSGPVLWRAARRAIPTGILELDVRPGIATRLLAPRVREIWLAAPEALEGLSASAGRAIVTGAPISPPDPSRHTAALARFAVRGDSPVLVITGGSQGSLAINRVVAEWVRGGGAAASQVIWATGRSTFPEFMTLHDPPNVHVLPFVDPMADAWSVADLCVARAGMMTLAELCAWGIPSVLIPLPSAAADHQTHNARAMAAAGAAVMLPQGGLDVAALHRVLREVIADRPARTRMAAAAQARAKAGAGAMIADRVS